MPISAAQACAAQVDYAQLLCDSSGTVGWLATNTANSNETHLFIYKNGETREITPTGFSLRSRVHEYGGRCWCFGGDEVFFVNATNQQLYRQSISAKAAPTRITNTLASRFMEPVWDAEHQCLYAIEEWHSSNRVVNRLVRIALQFGSVETLDDSFDFYASIALEPSTQKLAWISWNHPNQPWTSTYLVVADLRENQSFTPLILAGNTGQIESLSMARFSATGELWVLSDRTGYWNLYTFSASDQKLIQQQAASSDCISSPWQSGINQYLVTKNRSIVSLRFQPQGIELTLDSATVLIPGINHIREVAEIDGSLFLIVAGPSVPLQIIEMRTDTLESVRISPETGVLFDRIAAPELISFISEGATVFGYYYPANLDSSKAPPLILMLHGGPTSSTYPILDNQVQFWSSHGFAVIDLNYRGSSNLGRDYRLKLAGEWGVTEVTDIENCINLLVAQNKADPSKLFIRGRSSGGFSTLMALCKGLPFRAATSYFGVSDPLSLAQTTHKFESHYLNWLIGDPEKDAAKYQARSPVVQASSIKSPVLFLQGRLDQVVTADQTEQMVAALKIRSLPAEVVFFDDEGHGFKKKENQIRSLELELAFYKSYC